MAAKVYFLPTNKKAERRKRRSQSLSMTRCALDGVSASAAAHANTLRPTRPGDKEWTSKTAWNKTNATEQAQVARGQVQHNSTLELVGRACYA